jgi:hypothetical protein
MELPITTAQMMQSRARPRYYRNLCAHLADIVYELMKKSALKLQISRLTLQAISKFESSKTHHTMLSCFEFWAVKFGLGFGNSDLEL